MISELFRRGNNYHIVEVYSAGSGWKAAFNNVKNVIEQISDNIQMTGGYYCSLCQLGSRQAIICSDCGNMAKYLKGARQDYFTSVVSRSKYHILRDRCYNGGAYVINSSNNKIISLKVIATYGSLRQAIIAADFAHREALIAQLTHCYWLAQQTAFINDIVYAIMRVLLYVI